MFCRVKNGRENQFLKDERKRRRHISGEKKVNYVADHLNYAGDDTDTL